MKVALMQNARRLIERIGQHFPDDTRVTRPRGGMSLWLELNKKIDTTQLSHHALEKNISIAPGQIFSSSPGKYRNCLRLNCAVNWSDSVEAAVKTLGDLASGQ